MVATLHRNADQAQRTARIRELNDLLRATFTGGKVVITAAVAQLDDSTRRKILNAARTFNEFNRHNDPHGEHDCFFFQVDGERYFAKLDYYDLSMEYGSENPADPSVTTRVLTIGDAASY
jgi:hypothetical protein